MKLKGFQKVWVRYHQYRDKYIEGDKVYYQYQDSSAWLGPAEVVHHKGSIVWFYTNGNLQKVAGYKVKPYELVLRDDDKNDTDDTNNDAGTDKNGTDDTNNEESNIEDEEIKDIDKLEDLNAAMLRN